MGTAHGNRKALFGLFLLLLFIGVPAAEIALFIVIGGEIGVWATLALIVLTAVAGSVLIRQQGLRTLFRAQETLARQELPLREAFDGICLVLAGFLLLTPGFLTDAVGLLLLLPPFRAVLRGPVIRRMHVHVSGGFGPRPPPGEGPIIDGEFQEVRPDPAPPRDPGHLPRGPA